MSGPYKITEKSLYTPISNVLAKHGIQGVEEVQILSGGAPDLVAMLDEYKFVIEVKIDREARLLEDIPRAHRKALAINAQGAVSMLFPSQTREIPPEQLHSVAPNLEVSTAIVLLPWVSDKWDNLTLEQFSKKVQDSYQSFLKQRSPLINYDLIVQASQSAVSEIATALRRLVVQPQYLNVAMGVVGRFDLYKAMLKDLNVKEEDMKAWVADIAAYLFANQLLFYHILSQKKKSYAALPNVDPFSPPDDLLDQLHQLFMIAAREYQHILGPDIIPLIKQAGGQAAGRVVARYLYSLMALKPESVREELLGRLYQESIPPQARKNLGAFFTRPVAAKLLATLSIQRWDERVLDPACGSGTLLVEAYRRKRNLAPAADMAKIHIELLKQIYGIDVMHFAQHMASINLAFQNVVVPIRPNISAGDGIEPMVYCVPDDPPLISLQKYFDQARPQALPCQGFDTVIMNPPFTRRERLADVRETDRLDKMLGHLVRGKTGYWAYFVAAATNVLTKDGKLAVVVPEEFFAGSAAESLRRYLLLGEVFDSKVRRYVLKCKNPLRIKYIIRSAAEVAFSEAALYRDYLIVLEKSPGDSKDMVFVILKQPLDKLRGQIDEIAEKIAAFEHSSEDKTSQYDYDALRVHNVNAIVSKHIGNLKPIVGLNSVSAQELLLKLLDKLANLPTLGTLEDKGLISMRYYNPGQYLRGVKGAEAIARLLFTTRYRAGGKWVFRLLKIDGQNAIMETKTDQKKFNIPRRALVRSIRTYSGVTHMDITDEEEYAIINPFEIPENVRRIVGLVNRSKLSSAASDIKEAYNDLAGNLILTRKLQIPSPNVFWLAFYSDNRILGTTDRINVQTKDKEVAKLLALYLNSSIAFLQLLGFHVETRGAWIRLDKDGVWSEVHCPDFSRLSDEVKRMSIELFNEVRKRDVKPFYNRIAAKCTLQLKIDRAALKMLEVSTSQTELDNLYSALSEELGAMLKILEESGKSRRKTEEDEGQEDEPLQETLDKFSSS